MMEMERATAPVGAHGPRDVDQPGGSIVPEHSTQPDWAARFDRSRESWQRITQWQIGFIEDLGELLAERDREIERLHRRDEINQRIIKGMEWTKREAECALGKP